MKYLSVCSDIEAATSAWHPLGWTPFGFAEIEAFPSAVLAHHYGSNLPGEKWSGNAPPNFGDMSKFGEWPDATIDLLVGGTPCQSYSVAGLRKGLDDPRGNLTLTYAAIARRYRPSWLAWENVPGVLSNDGGRAFASLLGLLSGRRVEVPSGGWQVAGIVEGYARGYGLAWRVLDSQFVRVDGFGRAVPQRRRRVFVIGYLGDWRRAASVLFERESLCGNPAPRRDAGESVAPTISARTKGGGGLGTDFDLDGGLIPISFDCKAAGDTGFSISGETAGTLRGAGFGGGHSAVVHAIQAGALRENPASGPDGVGVQEGVAYTIEARAEVQAVAFQPGNILREGGAAPSFAVFPTLGANHGRGLSDQQPHVAYGVSVRRLTPDECAKLQGFSPGHCRIPWRGKPAELCPDGLQYKCYGNSMSVNVMRWLGRRIEMVNAI